MLAALRRAGAPYELSPGRLLRETLVTSGTMTNRVDRLASRGLVERHPDPIDRRGVLVRLTTEGKDAVDGAFTALLDAERELLADLSAADQKLLAGLLRRLLRRSPEGVSPDPRPSRASHPRDASQGGGGRRCGASVTDDNAARRPWGGAQQAMGSGATPSSHSRSSAASSHSPSSSSFSAPICCSSAVRPASFS